MVLPEDRPLPSVAAYAIAAGLVSGLFGYFLGQFSTLGKVTNKASSQDPDSGSDDDTDGDTDLTDKHGSTLDRSEECKMVLVVRMDLGMTKGKIAAQCSHATLACYKHFLKHAPQSEYLSRWEKYGQMKVALQIKSEEELETLQAQALSLGLCARTIFDAGRTQIKAGSATVLGIGPAPKSVIDQVTGHLKLL